MCERERLEVVVVREESHELLGRVLAEVVPAQIKVQEANKEALYMRWACIDRCDIVIACLPAVLQQHLCDALATRDEVGIYRVVLLHYTTRII